MRVLVTGGAGFIGSHTAKVLAREGHAPVVFDNLSTGHRWAVRWGPLVEGDLADVDLIRDTLQTHCIDAVIHFAASAYVGESMRNPRKYYRNNLVNTINLLDAIVDAEVEHIVVSSTSASYGNPESVPIPEEHRQHPVSPYGETKAAMERALQWYGQAYSLGWTAFRYFNAAGADPDGETGADHDPETRLIPLLIKAALVQRTHVDIFGADYPTPDGTAIRDYIHVMDLAEAHVLALRYLADGGQSQSLNLGTGQGHSVRDVIRAVERLCGDPVRVRLAPRRPGDPPMLVADATRATEVLGWKPRYSDLDTIVQTALQWYRTRLAVHL